MNKPKKKNMWLTAVMAIFLSIALSGCIVPKRTEKREHKKEQKKERPSRRHMAMLVNNAKLWNQWG